MEIKIDNVSELSLEKLEELQQKYRIDSIKLKHTSSIDGYVPYSVEGYKKCYRALEELTDGIKDEWSNAKKAIYIYRRISKKVKYDEEIKTRDPFNQKDIEEYFCTEKFSNIVDLNALIYGKAICQGYAHIYANALQLKGVKARAVGGRYGTDGAHIWNEVQINDEEWISQDVTWERDGSMVFAGGDNVLFDKKHTLSKSDEFEHQRYKFVSFDWTEFINKEFGINNGYKYGEEQQAKYIDILEKIDMGEMEFNEGQKEVLEDIKKYREKFCQDIEYTYDQLYELGFTEQEIAKIYGKKERDKAISQAIYMKEHIKEFEQEIGYTTEQLKKFGFTENEIECLSYKCDGKTAKRIDRREKVEEEIKKRKIISKEPDEEQSEGKLTLQEIGQETLKSFEQNPNIAMKEIEIINQRVTGQIQEK